MTALKAIVFDAYGTLLDFHAAMARHADRLGTNWQQISSDWRMKQTEYSWVRSLTGAGHHRNFWRLTEESLQWVAAKHGIADPALLADVLAGYKHLDAYPDAKPALDRLRERGLGTAILSNGEPAMLAAAVGSAGLTESLDAVLSVESVGVFKPDSRVYRLAESHFGLKAEEMGFVSSNPWDAFGAQGFGFKVFWVNRSGLPAEYDLAGKVTEVRDLSAVPALLG